MSIPTPRTPLPNGSGGTTFTVPQTTDNALWGMIAVVAGCVINADAVAATLNSASQLITVVIVLILIRSQLQGTPYNPARPPSSAPLASDISA